jgi:hypothetical protein
LCWLSPPHGLSTSILDLFRPQVAKFCTEKQSKIQNPKSKIGTVKKEMGERYPCTHLFS